MIYRIDVLTTPLARGGEAAVDPVGEAVRHQIAEFGRTVGPITTRRIFLIDSDASPAQVQAIGVKLLADPEPLSIFDHVYAETTDELIAQRDGFAAYLDSFEGARS